MNKRRENYYYRKFQTLFFEERYAEAFKTYLKYKRSTNNDLELCDKLEEYYKNFDNYSESELGHKVKLAFCEGNTTNVNGFTFLALLKNPKNTNVLYHFANFQQDYYNTALRILDLGKQALDTDPKYASLYASLILAKIYKDDIQGEQKEELKKKTLKYINKAIELAPNDVEYTLQLARYYGYVEEDYQTAIETYTKAIEIDPENSYFYSDRAELKEQINDLNGALEDYQKCLEMDPKDCPVYWSLAKVLRKQNKNDYATEQLKKSIQENENRPEIQQGIYEALAYHYEQINENKKALELYNFIKDNFPERKLYTLWSIADIQNKLEQYEEAIKNCEIILAENNPEFEYIYSTLYDAYYGLQRYDKALECAEELVKQDPKSVYENRKKAEALFYLKKYPEAIKAFKQTIKLYKNDNDKYLDYFYIAFAYESQKKIQKAIEYYQKAIEGDVEYFGTFFNLARIQMSKKQYKQALKNLEKSIAINPEYADSYVLLGQGYFDIKKYNKAFESFDKAIELDPQNRYVYANYGESYFIIKKYNKALEILDKAAQIQNSEDNLAAIYYLRGMVYEKLKDKTKAKADFAKALEIYPEFNVRKFKKNLFNH